MTSARSNGSSLPFCHWSVRNHFSGLVDPSFLLSGYLLVIFGTIGLLGNILIIAVLCQPKMRKKVFYNLLLALAVFDSLFILSYGIGTAYVTFACHPHPSVYLLYPIYYIFLLGSIYMTVAISLERYLGICHPHSQFSRRAIVYILPVVLISIAFSIPRFLKIKLSFVNGTLVAEYQPIGFIITSFEEFLDSYGSWYSVIILTILPLVALLFLNGSIVAAIKRSKNFQGTQDKREGNSTKILFLIVIIFFILHIPRAIVNLIYFLFRYLNVPSFWLWIIPIARFALLLNSSVNFMIYSLVGSNFRAELVRVFKYKKDAILHTNTSGGGEVPSLQENTRTSEV